MELESRPRTKLRFDFTTGKNSCIRDFVFKGPHNGANNEGHKPEVNYKNEFQIKKEENQHITLLGGDDLLRIGSHSRLDVQKAW